jgi:hypothetical protein
LKIAEIGATARFLMIAKDFIPGIGSNSFAIMKGGRECEASEFPGADVTIHSAEMRALHDGRCPVRCQGLIVASMATQRDRLTISHVTPCSFPGVNGHVNVIMN